MRTFRITKLLDGNGNKLNRKIRRDWKGLYVINHGMRGYLTKTVEVSHGSNVRLIEVTRQVDYYVEQ